MELLLDSDILCKLAAANLLPETAQVFGQTIADCRRLPALPHMLRRGGFRKRLGDACSDQLIPVVESLAPIPPGSDAWLDKLAKRPEIDPGEAQLFAVGAETGAWIATGDKRALKALAGIPDYVTATHGRIVILERMLLALCGHVGVAEMHRRIGPMKPLDTMAKICFSENPGDPEAALVSYCTEAEASLAPLKLWKPG
jgi:hypothetical protein